jgi:hypothetical protein
VRCRRLGIAPDTATPSAVPERLDTAVPLFAGGRPRRGAYPSQKRSPGSKFGREQPRSYEELRDTVRGDFVPFDEALQRLHGLVEELDIPEE